LCPASATNAIEPESSPKPASMSTNAELSSTPIANALSKPPRRVAVNVRMVVPCPHRAQS
jgi:hypothetical protein